MMGSACRLYCMVCEVHDKIKGLFLCNIFFSTMVVTEDGHFMERSWVAVFDPIPDCCLVYARDDRPKESSSQSVSSTTFGASYVSMPLRI
jgi:hypothetical protein